MGMTHNLLIGIPYVLEILLFPFELFELIPKILSVLNLFHDLSHSNARRTNFEYFFIYILISDQGKNF